MEPNVTKKLLYSKEYQHSSTEAVYRMEKIVINWTSDSRLVSKTYKELKIK